MGFGQELNFVLDGEMRLELAAVEAGGGEPNRSLMATQALLGADR